MKIAVCTIAYNEAEYIAQCVNQFKEYDVHHLVLVSAKPWNGWPSPYDRTAEIAKKSGAEVIVRFWSSEAEQRNWGLAYLYEYDVVLIVDPDEFYTKEDRAKLFRSLNDPYCENGNRRIATWQPQQMNTYWKTPDYIFSPGDRHRPCIAIDPKLGRFSEHRNPQPFDASNPFLEPVGRLDITLHHFSWVHSDEKVREKIASYSHCDDISYDWYDRVWLGWQPGSSMKIRPYGIENSVAVYSPAPEEIRKLIGYL